MSIGITNLLAMVGGDDVQIQSLDDAMMEYKAATSRNPTRITFGTTMTVSSGSFNAGFMVRTDQRGWIVWTPRAATDKVVQNTTRPLGMEEQDFQKLLTLQLSLQASISLLAADDQVPAQAVLDSLNKRIGAHKPAV